jgi:multiple sugar transport system permease protein
VAEQSERRVRPASRASTFRARLDNNPWIFILPAVAYLLLFSLYPLVASLQLSLQEYDFQDRTFAWVGTANYAAILTDPEYRLAFRNTAVFTIATVALELVCGMALALFMTRPMIGKTVIRSLLILPMVTTPMVVGLMWRFMFNADFGPINFLLRKLLGIAPVNWLGSSPWSLISLIVVDVWQWTPFAFLILYAGIQSIPDELLEAARIDGASPLSVFRYIMLPLLEPMITVVVLFRAIDSWRAFDTVFALTFGGPGRDSATLSFLAYLQGYAYSHLGLASAMAYLMVLFVILFVTAYRFLILNRVSGQ